MGQGRPHSKMLFVETSWVHLKGTEIHYQWPSYDANKRCLEVTAERVGVLVKRQPFIWNKLCYDTFEPRLRSYHETGSVCRSPRSFRVFSRVPCKYEHIFGALPKQTHWFIHGKINLEYLGFAHYGLIHIEGATMRTVGSKESTERSPLIRGVGR